LDQDGTPDACDSFVDSDADGVIDAEDRCQGFDDGIDEDSDGLVDGCDSIIDTDGDGTPNANDKCPGEDDSVDTDEDGIPDGCDSTPLGTIATTNNDGNTSSNASINEQKDDSKQPNQSGMLTEVSMNSALGYVLILLGIWMLIYIGLTGRSKKNLASSEFMHMNDTNLGLAQASLVEKALPPLEIPDLNTPPPIPATGLPEGWTLEQWNHYGHQWIEMNQ
jgi:hypothetical protein